MKYFLGVDLGTSSLKIILGNENGELLGSTSSAFSIHSPQANFSEENPADWLQAFDQALAELTDQFPEIKTADLTLGFSGQMHSLVLIDQTGKVLRPAILWNDGRTTEEVQELRESVGEHLLIVEKNIPLEGFTLPKILWVQKHQPEIWKQVWKFMLPKDYLVYYLTGKVFTDPSDASGTIFLDSEKQCWDQVLLEKFGIRADQCPEVKPSTEIIGEMTTDLRQHFELSGKVELVMGGADNACGAFGTITDPQTQGLISVGTSGVVLVYENEKTLEALGKYHYFYSVIKDVHYKMGVTLSAGYSLDWFKNILAPDDSFASFTQAAENSPIGSQGLTFLPYLFGERSPYFDPTLNGALLGLRAHHKRNDLIRAVMEGITFSLRNVYENMGIGQSHLVERFRITGGVVKNPFWLQLFADVFQTELEVLSFDEGPAYGALLCGVAGRNDTEILKNWQKANQVKTIYKPNYKHFAEYQAAYNRFKRLSDSAKEQ
ncbi:xylulokinase [Enterococcus sp. 669A]|uniref:Xylulose kinase n=1 Tax=Candidatus Enterococcus moelleringii TaxID=2815325 RepID=A0ABS3LA96_9ENTE|nr:xylulokinase [Enterococcus sp. 669A]MBO1306015.1 xylulokinase [Enterococcus sp. 669A]